MNDVNKQMLDALKRLLHKAYKQNWQDNYPSEVECARAAITAVEQVQQAEPADNGVWCHGITSEMYPRVYIESDDFAHDVRLYVDGDFSDTTERITYAKGIAKQLNAAHPPAVAVPEDMLRKVGSIVDGLRTKANNNPQGVKASTLESFANELCEVFEMLAAVQKGGA